MGRCYEKILSGYSERAGLYRDWETFLDKKLASILHDICKTASGNTLKARQNAQERSGRTQKGGQGQSLDEAKTRTKAYLNDIKKMNLTGAEKEIILDLINKFLK